MRFQGSVERWRSATVGLARHMRDSGLSLTAAAVAYNTFLALVPLAFALLGVAGLLGRSASAVDQVSRALDPIVPGTVKRFVLDLVRDAGSRFGDASIWVVVGSVAVALLLGSRAVAALQKSLAFVEHATERRPGMQMRLVAVLLTMAGGFALVVTSVMLVLGGRVMDFLEGLTGIGFLDELWTWLRIPIAAGGLYAFVLALYRFGPPEPLPRAWAAALVATTGAVLGSLGFGLYLNMSPELGPTFGALGAVAIALVWLYVGAWMILAGAVAVAHVSSG